MRRSTRLVALAAVALLLAACRSPVEFVAVREARFRSEVKREDRIALPLSPESRGRLLAFLRAGGDTDRVGQEVADPDAERRYGPLLDRLGDPAALALEDLTERDTYAAWLCRKPIRQVVDAREESPPAIDPVATTDGRYWWIFFQRHRRLAELLVVKAIPRRPPQ